MPRGCKCKGPQHEARWSGELIMKVMLADGGDLTLDELEAKRDMEHYLMCARECDA